MKPRTLSGLFVNSAQAQCSLYESGKMAFQCLLGSDKYSLDYVEISPDNAAIRTGYDFYLFNYQSTMAAWLDVSSVKKLPGLKMTIVLEVSPNDPFVFCSPDDFDAYCVLDPTLNMANQKVFAFPRPLEVFDIKTAYEAKEIPVIGSFGFATPGKGFEHVVDAVNREFERAVVRINIPYATYADQSRDLAKRLAEICMTKAKDGVDVVITHDYMTKAELIEWCAQNTLNCFLYDRNMSGLAATADQAISSGRPLAISKNNTFRHIQKFIKPFPYQTLKDAIETTQERVKEIQKAWAPTRFRERFEEVLDSVQFDQSAPEESGAVKLAVKKGNGLLLKMRQKIHLRTRLKGFGKTVGTTPVPESTALRLECEESTILNQLLDDLGIRNGSYLDIGSNNPANFNNTAMLYERGFGGVLVESDATASETLRANRSRDVVLTLGGGSDDAGPLLNINDLIPSYFTECPDVVSLHVESRTLQIVKALDFARYNPAVFCVARLVDASDLPTDVIHEFLDGKGYFPYKETDANTIFVNKNLYDFYVYERNIRQWDL